MRLYQRLRNVARKHPFLVKTARHIVGSDFLNNRRPYLKMALNKTGKLNAASQFGTKAVAIETTSACNAKCIMCTKKSLPQHIGIMSDALFEKVVREVKELGCRHITLSVYGEPLLDPHFLQRAKRVSDIGFQFNFFSNGSLLTDSVAKELLFLPGFRGVSFSHLRKGHDRAQEGQDLRERPELSASEEGS